MRAISLWSMAFSLGTLACQPQIDGEGDTLTLRVDTGSVSNRPLPPLGDTPVTAAEPAAKPAEATGDGKAIGAFIAASQHEIQHGRLAIERGSTQLVRDLGRSISRDHDDFVQRAREMGKRLGILAATAAGDTTFHGHASAMGDLRDARGVEFDRAYLQHEVDYHRWLIDAVNTTMLPQATTSDVKTFLQQSLPAFEAHMKAAQDLLAKT